jgi:GT2 family glycosyltransferase
VISFVIPVRDDAVRLRLCLERITGAAPPDVRVELVVADNGSVDGSAGVAREFGATVLDLPGASVGALRNEGARRASGDVLAFVDADNEIVDGWIAAALDGLAMKRTGAVGAPYHPPSPGTWVQRRYDGLRRHPKDLEIVEWLGSGNMALRRGVFEEVGGFDTALETCEDVDLSRKLRAHGYVLLADRRMKNVHHGDPETLRDVFFGELWRGRDNIRVSLRRPLSARTVTSAFIPLANLGALGLVAAGLAMGTGAGLVIAAGAVAQIAGVVALRASAIARPGTGASWPGALAVAGAYEAGRAFALAGRFGHARRRRTAIV